MDQRTFGGCWLSRNKQCNFVTSNLNNKIISTRFVGKPEGGLAMYFWLNLTIFSGGVNTNLGRGGEVPEGGYTPDKSSTEHNIKAICTYFFENHPKNKVLSFHYFFIKTSLKDEDYLNLKMPIKLSSGECVACATVSCLIECEVPSLNWLQFMVQSDLGRVIRELVDEFRCNPPLFTTADSYK